MPTLAAGAPVGNIMPIVQVFPYLVKVSDF
jgi:hypothetical protein